MFQVGDQVEILDHSEWHGLYATVDRIVDGIPVLFSVCKPTETYHLTPELEGKVVLISERRT